MKPNELRNTLLSMTEAGISVSGDVHIKRGPGEAREWLDRPVCNILEMAEELERLRVLSPIGPAEVMLEREE